MSAQTQTTTLASASNSRAERRTGTDRRRHSWGTLTYCGLYGRGRRQQARRSDHSYYLDYYDHRLVFTGLLLLLLSCLDALLTLTLLQNGAYEANFLMAHLLITGIRPFVIAKVTITAVSVLFLLMHAHFRILHITSGQRVLELLVALYGLLIGWECVLLWGIP